MKIILVLLGTLFCLSAPAQEKDALRRGDSLLAAYDAVHALDAYASIAIPNRHADLSMKMAHCYYLQHNYAKCLKTVEAFPSDSLDHDTMRCLFYSCKYLAFSQRMFSYGHDIIRRWPMDGEMAAELARQYLLSNQLREAERICNDYWAHDETCLAVNEILADIYMVEKQWQMAKDSYLLLLQDGDSTYKNLFNVGVCYERMNNPEEARRAFDVAIALTDSTRPVVLYHQGVVLNQLQEYEAAFRCFRMALQLLQPDNSQLYVCHRGMAEIFYAKGNYADALVEFEQAAHCDSTSITTPYYVGVCYEAMEDYPQAVKAYQRFLALITAEETASEELTGMMDDARKRIEKIRKCL